MRSDPGRAEQPVRHVLADVGFGREAANAPMGLLGRSGLKSLVQQVRHALVIQRPRSTRARSVAQSRKAILHIPRPPLANRRLRGPKLLGDRAGCKPTSGQQDDPSTQRDGLRRAPRARHLLQLATLLLAEFDLGVRTHPAHGPLRSSMYRKGMQESCNVFMRQDTRALPCVLSKATTPHLTGDEGIPGSLTGTW